MYVQLKTTNVYDLYVCEYYIIKDTHNRNVHK